MLKKLLNQSLEQKQSEHRAATIRKLMQHEAKIGGRLFGPVKPGDRREFFCLDEHTWVWYEEWVDQSTGQRRAQTTRYEVRPDCVLKVRNGHYSAVGQEEAYHLLEAARGYQQATAQQLYGLAT